MAHFANIEDGIVTQVIVIPNDACRDDDTIGQAFINDQLKLQGTWKRTSYNTYANTNIVGGVPYRKNYAGIGYSYDEELDAFILPQPYPSWILDRDKGIWLPPVELPDQDHHYVWNEENIGWEMLPVDLPAESEMTKL